ncbi:hypothetical protein ACQR1W_04000 [Bradyrhizobium sp. HKCCYLS1011]|uniref:hypothetical protein n=1 Tax=Bradyrhizobium sp. HKCCYLS1011 TaxID=3420733 RepID=UPI003EBFD516
MPSWLIRLAIGCGAMILSFIAMVLLATLAVYLAYGTLGTDYDSSPPSSFLVVLASPLFLLASIILGVVVGYRMRLPQHDSQPTVKTGSP